jgi:menaquinone-dependent protoporphyrinogen IX oxidase
MNHRVLIAYATKYGATAEIAEKLIVKGIKAPVDDYRDWEAITAWAEGIAAAVST